MPTNTIIPRLDYTPARFEVANGSNDEISFEETAATPLTATVTSGIYTMAELGIKVKEALEAAGASTYTVTYDPTTSKYTLTSDGSGGGGIFNLDVGGATDDLLPDLGITVDKSGSLSYTSDVTVPSAVTFTLVNRIRRPSYRREANAGVFTADGGATYTAWRGTSERYRFTVEFETVASAQSFHDFLRDAAELGADVTFRPDSATPANLMTVRVVGLRNAIPEQDGIYRRYLLTFDLEAKRPTPAADTITFRDLLDRGPTA